MEHSNIPIEYSSLVSKFVKHYRGRCPLYPKTIAKWFKSYIKRDMLKMKKIPKQELKLIEKIYKESHALSLLQFDADIKATREQLLNERYKVKFQRNASTSSASALIIIDVFYNTKQIMPIINGPIKNIKEVGFYFNLFGHQNCLVFQRIYPMSIIYSLKIDFHNWECKVLDQYVCQDAFFELKIFDLQNQRFLILETGSTDVGFWITDDNEEEEDMDRWKLAKIEKDGTMSMRLIDHSKIDKSRMHFYRLKNGIVWGIALYSFDFFLCEMDLNVEKPEFVAKFEFKDRNVIEYGGIGSSCYEWYKNVCYACKRSNNEWEWDFPIFAFDVGTQRCFKINLLGLGKINKMDINLDGVLTIESRDKDERSLSTYRYSLRKPDSMLNLTWFEIRRQVQFQKKRKLYKYACQNLPENSSLQPFYSD